MAQQTKRMVLVLIAVLALAVLALAGCGDTTKEIPMLDGAVVVKPFKAQDLPGFPMGYYRFYFRDLGVYAITVEAGGQNFFKFSHRVTPDQESRMRYVGHLRLSRAVADITVTSPDKRTARIQYDMGKRSYDEDNVGIF